MQDICFSPAQTLRCPGGRVLDLRHPRVMGILNLTPDSFYEGSRVASETDLLRRVEAMLSAGAAVLDLGSYSSRPGAEHISEDEEKRRLLPALEAVRREFPEAFLSVDTFRAPVAVEAVAAGADILNDISGGTLDADMLPTAGRLGVPYILMHLRGTPQTMQQHPEYTEVVAQVRYRLLAAYDEAVAAGVKPECLAFDPGIGFGKTLEHNLDLLRALPEFQIHGRPILLGVSRKSFIGRLLVNADPLAREAPTTALTAWSRQHGVRILRVHAVKENVQALRMMEAILGESGVGGVPEKRL